MWFLIEVQDVQQLHELLHPKCLLMVDLKGFDAFPHSDVDLFQYFQLVERASAVLPLARMLPGRSSASSDFNGYFFIGCVLLAFFSIACWYIQCEKNVGMESEGDDMMRKVGCHWEVPFRSFDTRELGLGFEFAGGVGRGGGGTYPGVWGRLEGVVDERRSGMRRGGGEQEGSRSIIRWLDEISTE